MHRTDRRGVVSVEFAAGAIVFFLMIQMVFEIGWQVATEMALEQGARAAMRFAVTGNSTVIGAAKAPACRAGTIVWLVTAGAPGLLQASHLQVASSASGGPSVGSGGAGFGGTAGQTVQYTFIYTQPYVTPIARTILTGTALTHTIVDEAENEPYPSAPC